MVWKYAETPFLKKEWVFLSHGPPSSLSLDGPIRRRLRAAGGRGVGRRRATAALATAR
jgi:hypothetical protein